MESLIYKENQLRIQIEYLNDIEDEAEKETAIKEYLDNYIEIESQLPSVVETHRNLELLIENCKAEENRIAERRKRAEKLKDLINNGIKTHMINNNIDKTEIGTFELSIRKSEKLIIDNEKEIPEKFLVIKTENTYPKAAIKKALKTENVPGVHLEKYKNLNIK